jgi:hypothetical protein
VPGLAWSFAGWSGVVALAAVFTYVSFILRFRAFAAKRAPDRRT